ncbi:MAG: hypothetical protein HIU93_10740 [Acidobacteria bacterium]|nr:hypothetical protein [Acidobacteriota bacterium]MBW4045240.1 hypothetical protein [Acidobacteriota bacterium]
MVTLVGIGAFVIVALLAYLAWGTGAAGSRKFNRTKVQHASGDISPHQEDRTPGLD